MTSLTKHKEGEGVVTLRLQADEARLVASTLRLRATGFREAAQRGTLALSPERAPDDLIEAWRRNGEILNRVADQLAL